MPEKAPTCYTKKAGCLHNKQSEAWNCSMPTLFMSRNYDSVDLHLNAVAALVMRRVQSGIKDLWKMLILAKKKGVDGDMPWHRILSE